MVAVADPGLGEDDLSDSRGSHMKAEDKRVAHGDEEIRSTAAKNSLEHGSDSEGVEMAVGEVENDVEGRCEVEGRGGLRVRFSPKMD